MLLSFCITCMNRYNQLKKTLPENLKYNKRGINNIEFILVDFITDATNGIEKYIKNNFKSELETGYLKYYQTDELRYWHSSVAKNTSHILASGKYVVNLDCDNFVGLNGYLFVLNKFNDYGDDIIIHQSSNKFKSGTMGRISMSKENFIKLGGYDEQLQPMAWQDGDIIERGKLLGLRYENYSDCRYNRAIRNEKSSSVINCYTKPNYKNMIQVNKVIVNYKLHNKMIIANNHFKNRKIGVVVKKII